MKRRGNEDRYAVGAYQLSQSDPTPSLVAVVADGVGGLKAGEVAAQLAVDVILKILSDSEGEQPLLSLQTAFSEANEAINNLAIANPAFTGMSTTAACVWIIGDRLFIASVGDSRIYLLRGENILQLTTDHTWVQEAVDSGVLTRDEALEHPNIHVIRRHLGSRDGVIPDLRLRLIKNGSVSNHVSNQGVQLLPGDGLLLCSDGLTEHVQDLEILVGIQNRSLGAALSGLVDLANTRGGNDNITLVGLQMPAVTSVSRVISSKRKKPVLYSLFVTICIALLGAMFYAYFFFADQQATSTITPTSRVLPILPSIVPTAISPLDRSPTYTLTGTVPPVPGITQTEFEDPHNPATITPWPTSTGLP
jgi:protein phosphatase